jgi:ATP-dependent Lhr-like helicase
VTNDTFAPLRALRWKRPAKDHRPRAGRLTALGPPEAAGRWSLVGDPADDLPDEAPAVTRTERAHALALALLERHGVVTREAVASEPIDGGFSAVYPVLRAMEEAGRIRRGYFVDGLGAAQFALPGAVDRLRAMRDQPGELAGDRGRVVQLLAAADPPTRTARPPWPRRGDADRRPFQRAAGAYVALVTGRPPCTTALDPDVLAADDRALGPRSSLRDPPSTAGSASW